MMKRRNFAATAPAEEAEATTASPAGAPELPKDGSSLGAIVSGWVATNGAPEGLANALRATRACASCSRSRRSRRSTTASTPASCRTL